MNEKLPATMAKLLKQQEKIRLKQLVRSGEIDKEYAQELYSSYCQSLEGTDA